jgi:Cdc6-like AAA superfamily ATPase
LLDGFLLHNKEYKVVIQDTRKTKLAEGSWIEQIQRNLSVYKCTSLTLPLIEKHNVDALITQIAGDRLKIERVSGVRLSAKLEDFQSIIRSDELENIWIIENLASLWQSASAVDRQILEQGIIDLAVAIRDKSIAVLAIDYGDLRLPKHLRSLIPHEELPLPSKAAIKLILGEFRLSSDRLNTISAGLGCEELRVGIRLALKDTDATVIDYDSIEQSLLRYKIVKLKELGLEFLGEPDISEFGGLDRLKDAVIETVHDFSPHAQELGIARPKGMMFVGPPGTGKTHTAKCIAGQLRWPLISVGIDAIKAGGADVLKVLLNRIEATAPCVVYFDELDKFFSSASDAQILGVLLTWLQEKTSETFVIATLNRLEKLPPELTRAGRFDRLFWIGFPNETERYEIVRLYANKYDKAFKTTYGRLDRIEWLNILNTTDKFTGAELKALVDRSAKLEFYDRLRWVELLEQISSASGDEQVALVDNAINLDFCQRTEWLEELDCIFEYTDDELNDRIIQIKAEPLQIHYRNLVSARRDVVSLYERNPAGILDIQNQAQKFSEPSSSPNNNDNSLFKVEAINMFGDN